MRTTLTLDDDVAAQIEQARAEDGRSFKEVVNEALRLGLAARKSRERAPTGPFTRPVSVGRPRLPVDDVSEALALAEGDDYR